MNKKIKFIILIFCVLLIGYYCLTLYLERIFFPRGAEVLHSYAETNMFEILNSTVVEVMDKYKLDYNSLVDIKYDNNGTISSVSINYNIINKIKAEISLIVSQKLSKQDEIPVKVPLGSFTNNLYLMGKGPGIEFYLMQRGCVHTDFEHNFESAGLNQVMHTLKITMTADVALIIPYYNTGTHMQTSAILAQTVINGETPIRYMDVTQGGI